MISCKCCIIYAITAGSQATKTYLKSQIDSLQKEFVALRDDVYESVKTQPVGTFKVKLTSFMDINAQRHHETALKEIIDKKERVDDIWANLNFYMNFLNYELLQHVLDKFQVTTLQERMKRYTERITGFLRDTQVCDFMECWPLDSAKPPEVDLREFVIKYNRDWNTCTLLELNQMKDRLTQELLLPKFLVNLQGGSSGSMTVVFSVPHSVVAILQDDIKNTEPMVFVEMDIETIKVDGVVYYAPLLQCTTHSKQSCHIKTEIIPEVCSNYNIEELLHIGKFACRLYGLFTYFNSYRTRGSPLPIAR